MMQNSCRTEESKRKRTKEKRAKRGDGVIKKKEKEPYNFLKLCSLRCKIPPVMDLMQYFLAEKDIFEKRRRSIPLQVTASQFQFIKMRKGVWGYVVFAKRFLCKKNVEVYKKYYMLVAFNKIDVINCGTLEKLKNQKDILSRVNFPFISHLEFTFQDKHYVYFGYPFIAGRTLRHYLETEGRLSEEIVRFYSAQLVLALEYLHLLNILHRNIKPENIVIEPNGYVKLIGFIKAKVVFNRTFTRCFNLEYAAPEVFTDEGYGKSVDWWALAATMYELGTGFTPFETGDYNTTVDRIMTGRYKEPGHFTFELKHLLKRLFITSIGFRAKTTLSSLDEIKSHKWFMTINWIHLLNRAVQPEYTPGLKNPLVEHQFLEFDEMYIRRHKLDKKLQCLFEGF